MKLILIILIVIVGGLYFIVFSTLNSRLKRGSRVAQFKVGGARRSDLRKLETREERQKRREVSLRDGPRLKRRFR
ncbi:MAG TPA: hypothetical protein VM123_17150 [archaeon]|nr:hypothetical protein [archaeon]